VAATVEAEIDKAKKIKKKPTQKETQLSLYA